MPLVIDRRVRGVTCEVSGCVRSESVDVGRDDRVLVSLELERLAQLGWSFDTAGQVRAYCRDHHRHLFAACQCGSRTRMFCPLHQYRQWVAGAVLPADIAAHRHCIPGGPELAEWVAAIASPGVFISSGDLLQEISSRRAFCGDCSVSLRELAARLAEIGIGSGWDSPRQRTRGYVISEVAPEASGVGRRTA